MTDGAEHDALFTALCVELGFCLHDKGQKRVVAALASGLDAATRAVFEASGADFVAAPGDLRRQVRDCIKASLASQAGTNIHRSRLGSGRGAPR